jgi:hypothetical protein
MEDFMKKAISPFVRAVFWGTVAGGGPFMLLTGAIAVSMEWQWNSLLLFFMPAMIAGAVVTLAMLLLGLPLTALLAHLKRENRNTYVLAGALLGALLPLVPVLLTGDNFGGFLTIPGAIAGTATAAVWGRWREEVAGWIDQPAEIFE